MPVNVPVNLKKEDLKVSKTKIPELKIPKFNIPTPRKPKINAEQIISRALNTGTKAIPQIKIQT